MVASGMLCAGKGLPNLYSFLRDSGRYPEPGWLKEAAGLSGSGQSFTGARIAASCVAGQPVSAR